MLFKCSDGLMCDLIEFLDNVLNPSEISFRCKVNPIARRSHHEWVGLVWRPLQLTMEVAVFFTLEVTSCLARALTHGIFFDRVSLIRSMPKCVSLFSDCHPFDCAARSSALSCRLYASAKISSDGIMAGYLAAWLDLFPPLFFSAIRMTKRQEKIATLARLLIFWKP